MIVRYRHPSCRFPTCFFCRVGNRGEAARLGIQTIGELAKADERMIRAHLKKHGQTIQGLARGEDLDPTMIPVKRTRVTAPVDIMTQEYAKYFFL